MPDPSEEEKADAARNGSEEGFRVLADTMPQIVWTAGPDGVVEYFNRRWYDYTGFDHKDWWAAVHPDDRGRIAEARGLAIGEGEVFEVEVRLRRCDGRYLWHLVRSVPVPDGSGRVVRRYGTATDIDRRKQAEDAVRRSEERLRLALEAGRMGTWEWHIPSGEVTWSSNLELIQGLPAGSFDGTFERFLNLIHPEDRGLVAGAIARSVEGRTPLEIEFRTLRPDGTVIWMSSRGEVLADEAGRPARMTGVAMDITVRKRLEEELRLRMAELGEADRRKDEFLATLAHELRNPLAPIRNALLLMGLPGEDGAGVEAERAMAERQVMHMARLIDDLMDLSRISRGAVELRREELDLGAAIRRAVDSARSAIAERGHDLAVELPTEPIRVLADPTRLEQVVWNLLSNAAKYTEPGGRIRVRAARQGGEAVIEVEDTGVGIEPAMLDRIFEMFVQAGRREERTQGGLGIGLSLVKRLVEGHGGTVSARSAGAGRGSTFAVRLPALPAAAGARPEPPAAGVPLRTAGAAPRRRILVVDDNVDAAVSLAKLLTILWNQEVRVAHDGPAGLDLAGHFRPDLVLLDIGMPGMDGYEVARQLRSRPELGRPLLVALSGWGQDEDRQRSKEAGFDHHIVKPMSPEQFRGLLGDWESPGREG